jgi:hypothetical protein
MNTKDTALRYRRAGFLPFGLVKNSKEPHKGSSLYEVDQTIIRADDNLAVFCGSANNLAVVDADNPQSQRAVWERLDGMGLLAWTTVVRTPTRGGLHFWLRVGDVPKYTKVYYKLNPEVGGGEFRLRRPSYVVVPWSKLSAGRYEFEQGGIDFFIQQPLVSFHDLTWLLRPDALYDDQDDPVALTSDEPDLGFTYYEKPSVLHLLEQLKAAHPGQPIQRIDYRTGRPLDLTFPSRSEAEQAVITGLVMAGWPYQAILELFESERPAHYMENPNRTKYLRSNYRSAVRYALRREAQKKQRTASFAGGD